MIQWEIVNGIYGDFLVKIENGITSFVPMVEDNADYQRYLKRDEPQAEHLTDAVE